MKHLALRRRWRAFLALATFLVTSTFAAGAFFVGGIGAREARAAGSVQASTRVSDQHPEAGAPFTIELTLSSTEPITSVSSPTFAAPAGVSSGGVSRQSRTEMHIVNGQMTTSSSVVFSWTVTASRPGTITLPAPSAVVDGSQVSGRAITVEVAASTGAPPAGSPPNPFFTLGPSASPFDFDDVPDDPAPGPAATDALAMTTGPDEQLFLRAVPDRNEAVLGQQVTVSFYVYYRVDFEMTERKEAPAPDFLRMSLLSDPGSTTAQYTHVGAKRFGARLIDRVAFFPLKVGKLSTGSISARFKGRRIGAGVLRTSNELSIDVNEPPKDGRPPSYTLGDVGKFNLTATVSPKDLQQGSSVGVSVRIEGTGNIPTSMHMPPHHGIEWLEPERRDAITVKDLKVGGSRTFGFVGVVKDSGKIDLGKIELPYFDADAKSYQVASVDLGSIQVDGSAPTPEEVARAKQKPEEDPLAQLPKSRTTLGNDPAPRPTHLPGWALSSAIALPPFLVVLGFGAGLVGGGLRRRRQSARGAAQSKVREALADARAAEKSGDVKALAGSIERAVHGAIEAKTSIVSRGVLRENLGAELEGAGTPKEVADEVGSTLALCERIRFSPDVDSEAMKGLVEQGTSLVKRIERMPSDPRGQQS